jgi:hypothetical protein
MKYMVKNKKTIIMLAIVAVVLGVVTTGIVVVHAATDTAKPNNLMSNLVNAIAQKFNLKSADVQQVFDEQKTQMTAQRQAKMAQTFTDRLNKAVVDGKLTQDQANKIIAKKAELEIFKTSLEGKTPTEIRAAMKAQMDSLKQWSTVNNIPQQYLMFGGIGKNRGHWGLAKGRV